MGSPRGKVDTQPCSVAGSIPVLPAKYTFEGTIKQRQGIQRYCEGSILIPLGTNGRGQHMEAMVVAGARPAICVVLFTAAFIVPLATAVGVAAGFGGGRLDDLLMTYVDV